MTVHIRAHRILSCLTLPWVCFTGLASARVLIPGQTGLPMLPSQLTYQSALANYRAYGDVEVQPWRAANDTVLRMGGWRAYAREVTNQPLPDQSTSPAGPDAGHHDAGKP
ncbi:MAG: hypothetical protein RJA34_141 [Pseudomonadota bacterium]|jgi:hypothetical protein